MATQTSKIPSSMKRTKNVSKKRKFKKMGTWFNHMMEDLKKMNFQKVSKHISDLFEQRPLFGYTAITIVMMVGVLALEGGSGFFKASIVESPIAFDGTTMPYTKVANWAKVGGTNTRVFSDYSASELIDAPAYNTTVLLSDKEDTNTINTKITYPIVYAGKYEFDHIEYTGSHPAVDIKMPSGTPIYAIANGIVTKSLESNGGFGNHIVIRHDQVPEYGTLYSSYSHMSKLGVEVGQVVKKGELIGYSGNSGTSTTPHMHFQIDKSTAPFHPYWPFTSQEMKDAGLSFWDAVNKGLGLANIKKYTIHPMEFVQNNKKSNTATSSTNTTKTSTTPTPSTTESEELTSFEIEYNNEKAMVGETLTITVSALGLDDKKLTSFSKSANVSSDDVNVPETITFKKGISSMKITLAEKGRAYFYIEYMGIKKKFSIPVQKAEVTESPISTFSTEAQTFSHFEITGPLSTSIDENILITITALDTNEVVMKELTTKGAYVLNAINGKITPTSLTAQNFKNGVATVKFTPTKNGVGSISIKDTTFTFSIENKKEQTIISPEEEKKIQNLEMIFEDVSANDTHAEAISYLKENGIINGYTDGTFKPEKTVSRAEAIKMIFEALSIEIESGNIEFSDVSTQAWFYDFVVSAAELGIVNGYEDGTFAPEKTVNRSEYFKILLTTLDAPSSNPSSNPFADTSTDAWYATYAQEAKKENLLDFGENFEPAKGITRGEVAETLYRVLQEG